MNVPKNFQQKLTKGTKPSGSQLNAECGTRSAESSRQHSELRTPHPELKILHERLWHFTSVGLGNCRAAQRVRREIEHYQQSQVAADVSPLKLPSNIRRGNGADSRRLLPANAKPPSNPLANQTIEQLTAGLSHLEAVGLANSRAAQLNRRELQRRITLNSQLATLNHLRLANDDFDSNEPRDKDGRWTMEGDAGAANTNSPSQPSNTTKPDISLPLKPTGPPREETYAVQASTMEGIGGLLDLAGKGVWNLFSAGAFENIGDLEDALKQLGFSSDQLKKWGFKDVEEDSGTTGEKPIEQGIQSLPPAERGLSRAGEGVVESTPSRISPIAHSFSEFIEQLA